MVQNARAAELSLFTPPITVQNIKDLEEQISTRMSPRSKPAELKESAVKDENAKLFIRNVKQAGKGHIYVYLWNIDKSETAPIGLVVDPTAVEVVCASLEEMGSTKTTLSNGSGFKFDLTTLTGFQGAHLDIYQTGKINVQWQKGDKSKKSPDFANLALFDVIELVARALKRSSNEEKDEEDDETTFVKQNNKVKENNTSKSKSTHTAPLIQIHLVAPTPSTSLQLRETAPELYHHQPREPASGTSTHCRKIDRHQRREPPLTYHLFTASFARTIIRNRLLRVIILELRYTRSYDPPLFSNFTKEFCREVLLGERVSTCVYVNTCAIWA